MDGDVAAEHAVAAHLETPNPEAEGPDAPHGEAEAAERAVEFVFSTDAELRSSYGRILRGEDALALPAMTVGALSLD